ncbi:MAG: DUF881 domain-containing protein [Patescibacteria group bacterium]
MHKTFFPSLLVVGLLTGVLLSWQFNTKIEVTGTSTTDEIQAKDALLKSYLDEQSYLQSRIVSLREGIENSQNEINSQTEKVNFDRLNALKVNVGLTELRNSGLEILIDDGKSADRAILESSSENLVQASDLRDIVNLLFAADAEAVAVNNQRIISTSIISSVGTTILVNNSPIAPPFVVDVIGDQEIILQRILNKSLLPTIYEKRAHNNILFEIYKKNLMNIKIYNGDLKTKYINFEKDDER